MTFDEAEYRKSLMARGIDPDSAADVAAKTAAAHAAASSARPRPATGVLEVEAPPSPSVPVSGASPTRPQRVPAKKAAKPAAPSTKPALTGAKSKAKVPKAVATLDPERAAILKETRALIEAGQLTLFDVAPFGNNTRAIPSDLGVTDLFTVRNKRTPRAPRQSHLLYTMRGGVQILFTGIELRADNDELVWLQVLDYAKQLPVGAPVKFSFYQMCKACDWPINGRYYERVEECLTRLQATALQIVSDRHGRLESLSLINRFRVVDRGTRTAHCEITIDSDLVTLFVGGHYSRFEWDKYRALSPITRRMFDYFVTHSQPYPILLESFRLMCGSDTTRARKWAEQTNKACAELNASGLVKHSWVEKNKLLCER